MQIGCDYQNCLAAVTQLEREKFGHWVGAVQWLKEKEAN